MPISDELRKLNLISGKKVCGMFDLLYSDILKKKFKSESEFVIEMWKRFDPKYSSSPSLNGAVFEGILGVVFYRSGVLPLFVQVKFSFVPNIDYDFVAYTEECGPIILSIKTSLRERYKQADLEGMMLRQVHRRAKSYLITLNEKEAKSVNKKISEGTVLGLDEVVVASNKGFDKLIDELKKYKFYSPDKVDVLVSNRVIT